MANYVTLTSDKSKKKAYLLCLFGGWFGLHRYYVGKVGTGLLYSFTFGLFLFGWFHDAKMIRRGKFTDNVGAYLRA